MSAFSRYQVAAVLTATLAVSLAGAIVLLRRMDRLRAGATLEQVLYISSPTTLRRLSLGYAGLVADIYWTRAVQYFGGKHRAKSREYQLLAPLLDITTELDPHLIVAYQFGSTFLAQKPPEGAGQPDKAVALVERGIAKNPNTWQLYYELGFLQYLELHDSAAAARSFERGAQVPGAHPFLRVLAATMAQHAGERQMARMLWTTTYQTTEDGMIRDNALKHLRALRVDEDITQLERLIAEFRRRTGSTPSSFYDLVNADLLSGIPADPLGHAYKIVSGHIEVADPESLPFITKGLPNAPSGQPLLPAG